VVIAAPNLQQKIKTMMGVVVTVQLRIKGLGGKLIREYYYNRKNQTIYNNDTILALKLKC
jgi:hypothetical protein